MSYNFTRFKRAVVYCLFILLGLGTALPSLLPPSLLGNLPSWYSANQLQLGLDLRGGSQLTMAVYVDELMKVQLQQLLDDIEDASLQENIGIAKSTVIGSSLNINLNSYQDAQIVARLARSLKLAPNSFNVDTNDKQVAIELSKSYRDKILSDVMEQSQHIISQRLDETGVVEPSIYRQGNDAIVIQLPGVTNPDRIRQLLGSTAVLSFHWLANDNANFTTIERKGALGERYHLEKRVALDGEHIKDARLGFNQDKFSQQSGEPIVTFKLDNEGSKRFADMTKNNIGRQLAIVLDDRVVSAPVINSIIPNGNGEISGSFTAEQAADLALVLRSGALPAKLSEIERHTVGPQLGSDAIHAGLVTGLLGAALIFAFMIVTYGRWGMLACAGLAITMTMIFSGLGLLRATLTLPGIAGLILTLGMAVDANILINERIREEVADGKKTFTAVSEGFKRAFGTIVDANMTTLIAVILLFLFGNGPIKGFAITIGLGICSTLLTTVVFTRPAMESVCRLFLNKTRNSAMSRQHSIFKIKPWFTKTHFNFMATRFRGLALSIILSLASLMLILNGGLELGVDFSGGSAIRVYHSNLSAEDLRQLVGPSASLQELGRDSASESNDFLLKLPASDGNNAELINSIQSQISKLSPQAQYEISSISAGVSSDFFALSVIALLIAGVGIAVYLWARYQNYFAFAAITTLALDLTKTFGFIALVGIEFDLTVIAALLALIGCSINDKVVVFDRIRENLRKDPEFHKGDSGALHQLINQSINSTLRRTILTSASTALAILPMAIAGGSVVSNFAIPLLFGIVVGTSSSIFVAAPLILYFGKSRLRNNQGLIQVSSSELRDEVA